MPLIGLLSDSHGRAARTRRAVDLLLQHHIDVLLHLGDVASEAVLEAMAVPHPSGERQLDTRLVFGNVDDPAQLTRYARDLGLAVEHPVGTLALPRGEVVFMHGDDPRAMAVALRNAPRYLCHGHTHQARDVRQGATRIICPGALHRAPEHTVALLDTDMDRLEFLMVEDS